MRILSHESKSYRAALKKFDRRAVPPEGVEKVVSRVIADVRARGDAALLALTKKFDGLDLKRAAALRVSDKEFADADAVVDDSTRRAVEAANRNVSAFAQRSLRRDWRRKNTQGVEVGERYLPFERVGVYVPGGTAPLVSTVIMTVTLARVAGVPEIVVTTPAGKDGSVNPALLHALRVAGATEVYKLGGAQAIAALALGTRTIRPVLKVYGPGNSYVVEAKRQVFGLVGVDLLPGPSEVLILADSTGKPAWIAADLLAQAEHGGDSLAVFVTDSVRLLEKVREEIARQAKALTRQGPVRAVLKNGMTLIHAASMEEGVEIANAFAPEHLSLISRREENLLCAIRTAGAVFLGNHSPVAGGDFLAGPSHELPTGGAGKSFAGLTVDQFQRRTSIVRFDRESIARSAPLIATFSEIEGLDAHGRSASIRTEGR